ncbi:hypothetical protein GGE45_001578 [Rhizobium aethiopicum]|uniref:Uncharacterized protein n=1 Tax=Rhizobium aethiopicum TaxID=1138170 RepID=A0A7W6QA70_9HYPH|nr:hypothetical protein [Rhizobium aethiopicum]MBB4192992.1 hypothetical protein [Rhizobium aethiopicum]MBB4579254.1 hypothetical protein [Rhizobium aethiopicum]
MTTDQNLMLYTKLAGFRLVVLANRFGCDSGFSRELHDRLIEGLDAAIARIHVIIELQRSVLIGDDEFAEYQLEGENEIFGRFTINLLDDLECDCDTHEFRVNGGDWVNAWAADDTGVETNYPKLVALIEDELGSLAPIIKDIMRETGIPINAGRVV